MNQDAPIDAFPNAPGLSKQMGLVKQKGLLRQKKGIWPFRYHFYSICSRHRNPSPECDLCAIGSWKNTLTRFFGSIIYKRFPTFWRYWVNRKQGYSYSYWKNWSN